MIVPRAYSAHSADLGEKADFKTSSTRPRNASRSRSPFRNSPPSYSIESKIIHKPRSNPVNIPLRSSNDAQQTPHRPAPIPIQPDVDTEVHMPRVKKGSAKELLSATSIPTRRKPKGRPSQRLPRGDHVAEFSRLLSDDLRFRTTGSLPKSFGASQQLDGLFGNIDGLVEGQMIVGSEGIDESVLTVRSASSDSLMSLASPDDYGSSGIASHRSSIGKSYTERRTPQPASPEDCGGNHPLLTTEEEEDLLTASVPASPPSRVSTPRAERKESRSFKSSLTASLKAIRTAAQSVSPRALLSSSDSDDFLARSFFDIQPSLTDDKRPPPTSRLPSPQLRRYLNPYTSTAPPDSPAQLHFFQDDSLVFSPKSQSKLKAKSRRKQSRTSLNPTDALPPVVPLATCLPPSIRTAHASSPPIWLSPDGTPSNKQTASSMRVDPGVQGESGTPVARGREPRENSDFLRVFVCEMEMRRKGKLNDDLSAGRARLWLPPVSSTLTKSQEDITHENEAESEDERKRKARAQRWQGWSIDEV